MKARPTAVLTLLTAAALVSGCGHPGIPSSVVTATPQTASPVRTHTADPVRTHLAGPVRTHTAGPVRTHLAGPVRTHWAGMTAPPLLGVDLYAPANYPPAVTQFYGHRMISYIARTLHARAVGIVWDFYMTRNTANAVRSTGATLTPRNVAALTRFAQADGLQVQYRPLVFVGGNGWEGLVRPARPRAWFASYYRAELPYLRLAQRYHVAEFVAETEMHELVSSPLWGPFFTRAASVDHGTLSYADWDGDYFQGRLLPPGQAGMDMYPRLRLPATATAGQVQAAMQRTLQQVPASLLRRTSIDETGIEARRGAYHLPAALGHAGAPDEAVQANWYLAVCRLALADHMRGVFIWKVDLADNPFQPTRALSVFEGRAGARAISRCAGVLR